MAFVAVPAARHGFGAFCSAPWRDQLHDGESHSVGGRAAAAGSTWDPSNGFGTSLTDQPGEADSFRERAIMARGDRLTRASTKSPPE